MNSNVFNDRNYKKFHQASKVVVIPEFVKSAPSAEELIFDKTASDLFADPSQRRYPLDSKSNAWLSRMYFSMDKEAYDKGQASLVEKKIEEAASFWGLDAVQDIPQIEKAAYTIPLTVNGATAHTVIISSKDSYVQAAEELMGSFNKLAYANRREYARGLYLAPSEFRSELPADTSEYIEKAAGFGMCTRLQVGKTLISRASLLRNRPAYSAKLVEMGKTIPETVTPQLLHKVAEVLDNIDRDCEFNRFYGHGLETPEESLFYVTEKTANMVKDEMIPLLNGNAVHKTAIARDDKGTIDAFFVNYFGEKPYGDDLQEKLAVIQSLPAPDATALQQLTGLQ